MSADEIRSLILSHVPDDGSAIGNGALISLLREQLPNLSDADYQAARDALVGEGVLAKGRGRGGSVYLAGVAEDEEDAEDAEDTTDEDDDGFELTAPEAARPKRKVASRKVTRKPGEPAQVLSYRHTDTRVNNPDVGVVSAANDPAQPKTIWTYDPHLDPALMFDSQRGKVETLIDDALASGNADTMRSALEELKRLQAPYLAWAGKAERTSFEVDTVSLHVHERVDPATILANAARRLKGEDGANAWKQADLFAAPFENLPLRQALDFYSHEKGWSNRLIAGDSLLVMNSLLKKESMAGQVQMIYIDPPYGIKYGSNFQPFTNKKEVKDGADADLTQEPEMIKAFRDTWELGIHSYLTYLRNRLFLSHELLNESGSVFIQISDENLHLVRNLLDEIFGPSNFVVVFTFTKKGSQTGDFVPPISEHIVWYAKQKEHLKNKFRQIYEARDSDDLSDFPNAILNDGKIISTKKYDKARHGSARFYSSNALFSQKDGPNEEVLLRGKYFPSGGNSWKVAPSKIGNVEKAGRALFSNNRVRFRRFADDFSAVAISNLWTGFGGASDKLYVVQTNERIIERCVLMSTDPGDIVFDPTCGSGTTAIAAEKWGRRWITCDTSRVAITLAKQRLMTAGFDYYVLRYPDEGLRGGFDYQTLPHVTLKSVANNPDIETIYAAKHPVIAQALRSLNAALSSNPPAPFKPMQGFRKGNAVVFSKSEQLEEWEVPFDLPENWPQSAKVPFEAFHAARQAMQVAMDQSIQANAEQETLYDKPLVDKTRLRITGPFSVEAVPAPSVLSLDEATGPQDADASVSRSGETSRQTGWRDELIRTGIRAKGGAMMKFADLEAIPGVKHLHASGSLDSGERVVVSFGPEHAALEQKQVERAIEEAQTLVPRPKFIVFCAFTFDPEAAKDIDELQWPGVTLLKAQMNTDLLTEDLKKARSSNQSFWLMGQPEVEHRKVGDEWQIEVHGFDYFDPRDGTLVSGGKSKIAMWSLDTDYDGRSLMPHQVFFPMAGAKEGWNRLKKTIRAELDEELLEQFHGTVSLPFKAGTHSRVAVKIVDDRGIESLKIINLEQAG